MAVQPVGEHEHRLPARDVTEVLADGLDDRVVQCRSATRGELPDLLLDLVVVVGEIGQHPGGMVERVQRDLVGVVELIDEPRRGHLELAELAGHASTNVEDQDEAQ